MKKAVTLLLLVVSATLPALSQSQLRLDDLKQEAIREIDSMQVFTQQMVDQIFSYSELGFQELETSRYVTGILEKNGFRVERGVAGIPTAWVATYGSGKPVIAFIADLDCIPLASQKPGVAYHDPIVEGAPGHGEGHNAGQAVQITAALAVKKLMEKYRMPGTLKLFPGVAEELGGAKAFYVRAGLFKDVDLVFSPHVSDDFSTSYGPSNIGVVSVEYFFHGTAAHAAVAPWNGRSALDAVEIMDYAWNMWREHLRPQQRSHYVIVNGGEQPNVVPSEASVWYYFREADYPHIKQLYDLGNRLAQSAATMTETTLTQRITGTAWPQHMNKVLAETLQKNIETVGMPQWSEADETLAKALQKEIGAKIEGLKEKVETLEGPRRELAASSNDLGDISWSVPTATLRYPANIPNLPGHSWPNAVAMATPIAHKGSTAGAKALAATTLDFLLAPQLVQQAWSYFRYVQTKDVRYTPLVGPDDRPASEINKDKMEKFVPELKRHYYDPTRFKTYLDQLGIQYPTIKK